MIKHLQNTLNAAGALLRTAIARAKLIWSPRNMRAGDLHTEVPFAEST